MTAYSLHKPFTAEDAKALLGKTADITFLTDADTDATDTRRDALVTEAYVNPRGRVYLETVSSLGKVYVPGGDVREVANVRDADSAAEDDSEDEDDEEQLYSEYSDPDGYDRNGAFDGFAVYSDADPGM